MPLATDALIGDHFADAVAEQLDAFVAPTVRIGCSEHHLGYAGTLSIREGTFAAIVADLVASFERSGFRRIVLLPTHGGNFAPLAAAVEPLEVGPETRLIAITDLTLLLEIAKLGEREFGIPLGDGGLHAGEWETSMLAAIQPELLRDGAAEPGFRGGLEEAIGKMFEGGVRAVSENGVIGDPSGSTAEHGRRYWEAAVELAVAAIDEAGPA